MATETVLAAEERTPTAADVTRDPPLPVPATELTSRALGTDVTAAGRETTTDETEAALALAGIEAVPGSATTVETRVLLALHARNVANAAAPLPVVSEVVLGGAIGAAPALAPNAATFPGARPIVA
jgi:hypothetical protein